MIDVCVYVCTYASIKETKETLWQPDKGMTNTYTRLFDLLLFYLFITAFITTVYKKIIPKL